MPLLKALGEAYVTFKIFVDEIDQLVGNITAGAYITFTNEKIPPRGRDSIKAHHITIKCKSHVLPQALLNNGSSLNMIPMSTLSRLPIDLSDLKKSQMVVQAFDGTKREILGNIKLLIQVGLCVIPETLFKGKFVISGVVQNFSFIS